MRLASLSYRSLSRSCFGSGFLFFPQRKHTHAVPARLCSRPVPIETEPRDRAALRCLQASGRFGLVQGERDKAAAWPWPPAERR
jgi:hypothetical protein